MRAVLISPVPAPDMLTHFIRLVKDRKFPLILVLGRILKVVDVFADDLAVGDEIPLTVDHVRDHHDLIRLLIRELERLLGRLDIVCHYDRLGSLDESGYRFQRYDPSERGDAVPQTDPDI